MDESSLEGTLPGVGKKEAKDVEEARKNVVEFYSNMADNVLALLNSMKTKGLRHPATVQMMDNAFPADISVICATCMYQLKRAREIDPSIDMLTAQVCKEVVQCPTYNICHSDQKVQGWHLIRTTVYLWHDSPLYKNEGNRYPLCERECPVFEECEQAYPTDTEQFTDLPREGKDIKVQKCLGQIERLAFQEEMGEGKNVYESIIQTVDPDNPYKDLEG